MKVTVGTVVALLLVLAAGTIAVAQTGIVGADPAEECSEADKRSGAFGECVSERASAFGRCVSAADERGEPDPEAVCADLKRDDGDDGVATGGGNGNANGGEERGEGDGDDADGGDSAAGNPTTGLTKPPAVNGREFGRQVSERARRIGGGDGDDDSAGAGEGADRNPTAGLEKPPAVDGREFGRQVSERARGNAGPPEGSGPPEGAGPPERSDPPEGAGPPAGAGRP